MTRAEMEHAVWQALTTLGVNRKAKATAVVAVILGCADAYASGDTAHVTAMRRAVLDMPSPRPRRTP